MLLLLIHETMWNKSCLYRIAFVQIFLFLNVIKNLTNCLLGTKQLILKQFYSHSVVCSHHFTNSGQLVSRFLTDTCPHLGSSQMVLMSISASLKPSKDRHMRQTTSSIICFCGYFPEFEINLIFAYCYMMTEKIKTIHTWGCKMK
jgi:hypothetical protein